MNSVFVWIVRGATVLPLLGGLIYGAVLLHFKLAEADMYFGVLQTMLAIGYGFLFIVAVVLYYEERNKLTTLKKWFIGVMFVTVIPASLTPLVVYENSMKDTGWPFFSGILWLVVLFVAFAETKHTVIEVMDIGHRRKRETIRAKLQLMDNRFSKLSKEEQDFMNSDKGKM